eukprot:1175352-Prymnesium_polylepis.1
MPFPQPPQHELSKDVGVVKTAVVVDASPPPSPRTPPSGPLAVSLGLSRGGNGDSSAAVAIAAGAAGTVLVVAGTCAPAHARALVSIRLPARALSCL